MKAIITVIGKDKSGIIAKVSTMLAENKINIEDISQTIIQGNFTMIMLVSFENALITLGELSDIAKELSKEIGVAIHIQNEEIFNAIHTI